MRPNRKISSLGIVGFGAFGRLMAEHLHPRFDLIVNDPAIVEIPAHMQSRVSVGSSADVCCCDVIVLAVPVGRLATAIRDLRPHLRPGHIVVDVGSVKVVPVQIMTAELPSFVDIVGTHPLFGPQSARNGIQGRKIAVCPVRGNAAMRIAAYLRQELGLQVFVTSPDFHDREAAVVQGLTHLMARVLVQMEPLPTRMTTASFDLLMEAVDMVRDDAPGVYDAIERDNPFSADVRERFFALASEATRDLEHNGSKRLRTAAHAPLPR